MLTTLAIGDDVLAAAEELATAQQKTVGEVVSSLARIALMPTDSRRQTRNEILLLPVRPGAPRVTSEQVKQLNGELM